MPSRLLARKWFEISDYRVGLWRRVKLLTCRLHGLASVVHDSCHSYAKILEHWPGIGTRIIGN